MERDERGVPILQPLTDDRLRHHLARAASWFRLGHKGSHEPALPPMHVVRDMLASPAIPLPALSRVVEAPCFDRAGRLHLRPGYSSESCLFYAAAPGFVVPDVPAAPTAREVAAALSLLRDDLLVDFPFVGDAEQAHAIAGLLLFFCRELIDGPTPLHLIEKPTPGVGASLLVQALTWPALGREATVYRGEIVWNATRKRDRWGSRQPQARPETEWLRVPAPQTANGVRRTLAGGTRPSDRIEAQLSRGDRWRRMGPARWARGAEVPLERLRALRPVRGGAIRPQSEPWVAPRPVLRVFVIPPARPGGV